MERATVKFDGGNIAILCSYCRKILRKGKDLTNEEMFTLFSADNYLPAEYCDSCKKEGHDRKPDKNEQ